MDDLFSSLMNDARWHIARRTYGSSHNTLIGLVVDWWITFGLEHGRCHRAMEGAPQVACKTPYVSGKKSGDAVFVEDDLAVGVAEVEGGFMGDYLNKLDTMGGYFNQADSPWSSLRFGLFFAYPTKDRQTLPFEQFVEAGKELVAQYPGKKLIVVTMDKEWGKEPLGPLFKGRYYHEGRFCAITGALIGTEHGEPIVIEQCNRTLEAV